MRRIMVQMRLVEYGVNAWGRRVLMMRIGSRFWIMTSVLLLLMIMIWEGEEYTMM
jgi:hypothetical protein